MEKIHCRYGHHNAQIGKSDQHFEIKRIVQFHYKQIESNANDARERDIEKNYFHHIR